LWDFKIYTNRVISARHPDIVVINDNTMQLKDVSISTDHHIMSKENEKIEIYQDLRIELERLWQKKTLVIPIVIGEKFTFYVDLLDLQDITYFYLQRISMLGTTSVLHWVLQLSGTE